MNIFFKSLFLFSLLLFTNLCLAKEKPTITGELYHPQSAHPPKNLIYTFERYESGPKDKKKVHRVYKNTKGEIVATETAFYENDKVVRFELNQKQINDTGVVELKEGILHFEYNENGKIKKGTEKLDGTFITADDFVPFVQKNWDALLEGKKYSMRYPVVYRLETIGFQLEKTRDLEWEGKPAIELRMRASSFLVAMLVSPLYLTFDKNSKKLVKMVGRTTPREFKGGKWVDWDALILYKHK